MEALKETFRRHGLTYTLLKRNDLLCIYGVSGTYTDDILHYEVMKIRIRKARSIAGKNLEDAEAIPSDEEFGRTKTDQHFQSRDDTEAYFASWCAKLTITGTTKLKKGIMTCLLEKTLFEMGKILNEHNEALSGMPAILQVPV